VIIASKIVIGQYHSWYTGTISCSRTTLLFEFSSKLYPYSPNGRKVSEDRVSQ